MVMMPALISLARKMHFWFIAEFVFCLTAKAIDTEWYVAPNGLSNGTICGTDRNSACRDITLVLDRYYPFVSSTWCYLPRNDSGTTTFFFEGTNYVPPLCVSQWSNLVFAGLGTATIIVQQVPTPTTGAPDGLLSIDNCTNVTVHSLQLASSPLGRSVLYIGHSRNISVRNCAIAVTGEASVGLHVEDSSGDITVESTVFYGNGVIGAQAPSCALRVVQGSVQVPFGLHVYNCTFQDVADYGAAGQAVNSYVDVYTEAIGLRLRFGTNATGNVATVQNSVFTRLRSTASNVVGVDFDTASYGNLVQFVGCEFRDNTARYGGGVSAYFWINSSNNALQVQDCNFTNNTATLEGGGILGVFISEQVDNRLEIKSSTFIGNTATYGAGVFILNNPAWYDYTGATYNITPSLVPVSISNCTFTNNMAPVTEGIVSVLSVLLFMSGRR